MDENVYLCSLFCQGERPYNSHTQPTNSSVEEAFHSFC